MSKLLRRQLKKLGLTEDFPPDLEQWRAFVATVQQTYLEADQDRYTIERSMMISSREMEDLYHQYRESELRFRRLFDSGFLGIIVATKGGEIVEANDAFLTTTGFTRGDLERGSLHVRTLTPPEWQHVNAGIVEELRADGSARPREQEYFRKDGSRVPILVGVATLGGDRNISFSFDLTELKRAVARKVAVVDRALDAIVGTNHLGIITEFNPAAEVMFGYSRAEVLGQPLAETLIPTTLREAHEKGLREYFYSGSSRVAGTRVELKALRRDGTEIPIELAITRLDEDVPPSFIGFIRDLSVHKKFEEARVSLEEQLRQSQKLEAVGSLAGGVAHDFNNMLSVILSYSAMIRDELSASDPMRLDLEEIHKAGMRARNLTRQLLAFSRQQVLSAAVFDLSSCVASTERMLRRIIPESIELSMKLAKAPVLTCADQGQIEQVIVNLVVNARDAMPTGGKITIETSEVVVDEDDVIPHVDAPPGNYVLLVVSDTGTGMNRETVQRAFEPFFTTKEKGKGTGLGLSTVFGIIKQSRGYVTLSSEPARGTTLRIYLPSVKPDPVHASRPPARSASTPAPQRGRETILLVEDDEQVRAVALSILRRSGYIVLCATNAGDAMIACDQHKARIHLLLTDVVMPRMGGPELAERVRTVRPDTKVLFMSGYADDAVFRDGALNAGVSYLQKPLTPTALLRKVRAVLDDERTASG